MKITTLLIGAVVAGVGNLTAQGFPEKPPMQEAITPEQLDLQFRKAQQEDPMKQLVQTTGEDPSVKNRPPSLLENSDFITFGNLTALVPKKAIIQTPKNIANRVNSANLTRLVGWTEFYAANRGWITTLEVSRSQAEGNTPLAEEVKEHLSRSGNLIVATFKGSPISLLPLKPTAESLTSKNQTK